MNESNVVIPFPGKRQLKHLFVSYTRHRLETVFVLSTGRVGTDTLRRLLNLSPFLHAVHEPEPYFLEETRNAYQIGGVSDSFAHQFVHTRMYQNAETSPLRYCLNRRSIYVETSNRLTYVAPQLAKYLPRSRFIFLHRHPADVVRSGMRRGYYQDHIWDKYRVAPQDNDPFHNEWNSWTAFQKCCWYWQAVNDYALNFLNDLPPHRRFQLRSEDLYSHNLEALNGLFKWVGISPPPQDEVHEVLSIRHNKQNQGEFPHWTEWSSQQLQDLQTIAGATAQKLGYQLIPEQHSFTKDHSPPRKHA